MNFYEHHLGDYAEATAHLSFVEDAAYSRMIRKYYSTERPLPCEIKAVQRLVGARTSEELKAVEAVLGEFFALQEDGWHNTRCDAELARYVDKRSKAQSSARARWSALPTQSGRTADAQPPHPEPDANASANALPTQSGRYALQSPVSSPQSPVPKEESRRDTPRAPRSVATRLPAVFELTAELAQIASTEGLAPQRTFEKFCDYWHSASGANARKHDWKATWRNWCRTEADRLRSYGGGRVTGLTRAAKSADELEREASRASG